MIIKNIFVPIEECLDLFRLGFKEDCLVCYRGNDLYSSYLGGYFYEWKLENNSNLDGERWIACPTFEQVFEWFREKHNYISYIYEKEGNFKFNYGYMGGGLNAFSKEFSTYQDAKLNLVKKLIKIISENNDN